MSYGMIFFLAMILYHQHLSELCIRMEDSSQSSLTGRGKNKRFWKREEEEALIDGLLELKANPEWKAEGGFKNGYMLVLEKMFHEKFPACGLKAVPHIESKVKWFKDKYAVVNEMIIRTSGFKWDDEKKMIQCERQAYDDFCKVCIINFM